MSIKTKFNGERPGPLTVEDSRAQAEALKHIVELEPPIPSKNRVTTADPQRFVHLLIATYQTAVFRNSELTRTQAELNSLNEHLEDMVVERTVALSAEIVERKQAEETLRLRLIELEALHTASAALRMARTLDEALPILLDATLVALDTNAGVIWLYQSDSNELRVAVARGWFKALYETPLRPSQGIGGMVFASGQACISVESWNDPMARAMTPDQTPAGWGGAYLPIRADTTTIGVLAVAVPVPCQITPERVRLLESLAEMAGATAHRMHLHDKTVRQLSQLQAFRKIDRAITGSFDLRLTLDILAEQTTTQLNVDAVNILLLDPTQFTLEYVAGRGFPTDTVQDARLRMREWFVGRATLEQKPFHIPDLGQSKTDFLPWPYISTEGFVAYFAVPLIAHEQVVGVLEIFHRTPLAAGPEWFGFLETIAGQAAIAIDNAQLFHGLQRSNTELISAYDATIEGWSRALDLRDHATEGHSRRVAELTVRLAQAMGMSGDDLGCIRRGALLHDIGKIGIPDGILLKPGRLSNEERTVMRQHPALAYELLSPITYLQLSLDIPHYHHEKWDGTGYPRGLKGEQIPLAARLFAVVDVWDALCSDRPYRSGWPEVKVREHVSEQAGRHFDPNVVQAFFQLLGSPTAGER